MMPGVVEVLLHIKCTACEIVTPRRTICSEVDHRLQHDDAERLAMRGRRLCCDDRAAPTEAATSGAACGACCRSWQTLRRRDGYFSAERWKITIEGELHDLQHRLFLGPHVCSVTAAACTRGHNLLVLDLMDCSSKRMRPRRRAFLLGL